jgi:hypothetical protein
MIANKNLLRTPLTLAFLALASLPLAAQVAPAFEAAAYGTPSGPGVFPNLGLILEHVDTGDGLGSLRLFGGVPGQTAAILAGESLAAESGLDGTTRLVGPGAWSVRGTFDQAGTFSVPLSSLPREMLAGGFFAQGAQSGLLAVGPIRREGFEVSQGLQFVAVEEQAQETLELSVLASRLPEYRRDELDGALKACDVDAFLATALDSDGDEVAVKLEGDFSVSVIPALATLGGKAAIEALVKRESSTSYLVAIKRDVALAAGIGLGDFAGVEGAKGLSVRLVFRFPSATGAARGLFGIWLANRIPLGADLPALPSRGGLDLAEDVWAAANAQLQVASARVSSARTRLANSGGWGPVAALAKAVAVQVLVGAQHVLSLTQQFERNSHARMLEARGFFEQALEGLWKAQRLFFEVDGARRYSELHRDGFELTCVTATEFKASLLGGTLTIQGTDLGFKAGIERTVNVYARLPRARGENAKIAATLRRKKGLEAWGGLMVGGRACLERSLVANLSFEMIGGQAQLVSSEVSFEVDAWARYEGTVMAGNVVPISGVVSTSGVGRTVGLALPTRELAGALASIDGNGTGLQALANVHGDLSMGDYRIEGYVSKYGLSIAGNGGSIGFSALTKDFGAPLEIEGVAGRRVCKAIENWNPAQP